MKLGQCRNCMQRREVFSIGRMVGGNYRRAQSHRRSSICAECAVDKLEWMRPGSGANGWSTHGIHRIASNVDSDRARAAVARYDELNAAYWSEVKAQQIRWEAIESVQNLMDEVVANGQVSRPLVEHVQRQIRTGTATVDGSVDFDQTRESIATFVESLTGRGFVDSECQLLADGIRAYRDRDGA